MPDVVVEVQGLEQLQRALRLSDAQFGRAIDSALKAGALDVTGEAKRTVPVWTHKLQKSIQPGKVQGSGIDKSIAVGIAPGFGSPSRGPSIKGQSRKDREAMRWNRGDPQVYGPFVERGTRKMAARPFLVPALEQRQQEVMDRMRQAFDRVLATLGRR